MRTEAPDEARASVRRVSRLRALQVAPDMALILHSSATPLTFISAPLCASIAHRPTARLALISGAAGGREGCSRRPSQAISACAPLVVRTLSVGGVYDGSAGDPTAAGGRQALQYLRFGYADADVAVADVVDFGIDRQQQDALFVDRRDDIADDLFVGFDDEFFRNRFRRSSPRRRGRLSAPCSALPRAFRCA